MSSTKLDVWFEENKRFFPWRENPTPYRVWVSEVMLQQTRAQVVISYFERWMKLFPSIIDLAEASLEQVIKVWEGLGYYRRARNLHAGAKQIVLNYGGKLPEDKVQLLKIPGIGAYTVSAILSFGFHKRAAAIDGNVTRVITRYAWIDEDIGKISGKRLVEAFASTFLSLKKPWVTAEALIELGATICSPIPRCEICPLSTTCQSYLKGNATALPIQSQGPKVEKIVRGVAVIEAQRHILVKKNPSGQLMGDLWEFPYFEQRTPNALKKGLHQQLGLIPSLVRQLKPVTHSFTRFLATLIPFYFAESNLHPVTGYSWIPIEKMEELSFSAGHRKIMKEVLQLHR